METRRLLLILGCYQLLSVYFVYHFLYVKKTLSDKDAPTSSEHLYRLQKEHGQSPETFRHLNRHCEMIGSSSRPKFDRLVFLLIDALRIDFLPTIVDPNKTPRMPYLENKLASSGIGLVSRAEMPTVTTPRTSTMLSGQLASYMNYLLHYRPKVATGDWNLVEQFAFAHHKRVVFYGDETWPELFPASAFVDLNVTNTLFIEELVQIDQNVTWNVERRLDAPKDWNVMFLHYLGIDHIGHSIGYDTPKMSNKLLEMDNVFRKIYDTLVARPESSLIVVVGDHGMANQGGHGGDTYEEKHSALAFISTKGPEKMVDLNVVQRTVAQLDVAPTVASLFGLELDSKNEGVIISSVLERFQLDFEEHLCLLLTNVGQLYRHANWLGIEVEVEGKQNLAKAIEQHWTKVKDRKVTSRRMFAEVAEQYEYFLRGVQQSITQLVLDYDFFSTQLLVLGLCYLLPLIIIFGQIDGLLSTLQYLMDEVRKEKSKLTNHLTSATSLACTTIGRCLLSLPLLVKWTLLGSLVCIQNEHLYWQYLAMLTFFVFFIISLRNVLTENSKTEVNHAQELVASLVGLLIVYTCLHWKYLIDSEEKINYGQDIYSTLVGSPSLLAFIYFISMIALMFVVTFLSTLQYYLFNLAVVMTMLHKVKLGQVQTNVMFDIIVSPFEATFVQSLFYLVLASMITTIYLDRFPRSCWLPRKLQTAARKDPVNVMSVATSVWMALSVHWLEPALLPVFVMAVVIEKLFSTFLLKPVASGHNVHLSQLLLYVMFANWAHYALGNTNSAATERFVYCLAETRPGSCLVARVTSTYAGYVFWLLRYLVALGQHSSNTYTILPTTASGSKKIETATRPKCPLYMSALCWLVALRMLISSQCMLVVHVMHDHFLCWGLFNPKLLWEVMFTSIVTLVIVPLGLAHLYLEPL